MTETAPQTPPPSASVDDAIRHDVFISYSRADRGVIERLVAELTRHDMQAWVDLEDIPPSAEWMAEIGTAIEAADGYMVVVSPDLARSSVCAEELELAVTAGKRIVPVMIRPTDPDDLPTSLSALNWIDATDGDLPRACQLAVEALTTDLEHVRAHSRLQAQAGRWERKQGPKSLLLRGGEITEAEMLIVSASEPRATPLQARFVRASRAAATGRQHWAVAAIATVLLVSLGLSALALVQRSEAVEQRDRAEAQTDVANSRALASQALLNMDDRLDTGMLLALEAYRTAATPEAMDALHVAAQRSIWIERTLRGTGGANAVATSPDGALIAASDNEGRIRLWSTSDGTVVGSPIEADARSTLSLAFAHDGTLASGGRDGSVRLWDPATGASIGKPLSVDDDIVSSVAFARGGDVIVGGTGEGLVYAWDARSGEPVPEWPIDVGDDVVWGLASADRADVVVASTEDSGMASWDLETGKQAMTFDLSAEHAWGIDVSPDGRLVAVATTARVTQAATGEVLVFDLRTGERIWRLLGHADAAYDVAFSPDGRTLASASADTSVRLWNLETGEPVSQPLRAHTDWVNGLAFTPDGGSILSASSDGTVVMWDAAHRLIGGGGPVNQAVFHPDGEHFATTEPIVYRDDGSVASGSVILWDAGTLKAIATYGELGAYGLAYSPDGTTIVGTALDPARFEGDLRRWNPSTLEVIEPVGKPVAFLTGVAASADGATVATGSLAGEVQLWDAHSGEPVGDAVGGQEDFVYALAFSPDGSMLVTTSFDGTVVFRDPSDGTVTGEPVVKGRSPVYALGFSPDGRHVATGTTEGRLLILNAETHEPEFERAIDDGVQSLAFSPNGSVLAVGTTAGEVALLDAASGDPIGDRLPEQRDWINSVAFYPTGSALVSASDDGSIVVLPSLAWSEDIDLLSGHLCAAAGRNLEEAEWDELISFAPYRATCDGVAPPAP